MARSDTRYSVYPAPKAVEVVGNSAPALNLAIECWGALLARAMADNARTFSKSYSELVGDRRYEHCLHDWALMGTVLRTIKVDPDFANPGELLATAVQDAHRLESIGDDWYFADESARKDRDAAVDALADKLRMLDYAHAWAVISATQWFWEHSDEGIDIKKEEWWTLGLRREWSEKQLEREPEKLRTELDQARKVYELSRMNLEAHENMSKRATQARAQLEHSHKEFERAQARLKELERRPDSQDQGKWRSQIDKCCHELERARAHLRAHESEFARVEHLQANRESIRAECKSAEQRLMELERKYREWLQLRAELEHARNEFKRSETYLKQLEVRVRNAS
jgi:hypothetical protein